MPLPSRSQERRRCIGVIQTIAGIALSPHIDPFAMPAVGILRDQQPWPSVLGSSSSQRLRSLLVSFWIAIDEFLWSIWGRCSMLSNLPPCLV